MATTELRKRKQEEYEMQLFDFHSRAVFATLKNIVHDRIKYKCQKLCETIKEKYKPDDEKLGILKNNEKQLTMAYYRGAVPHVRAIETIVNKHICIPPNILMEEDALQRVQYTEDEFRSIEENLKRLQEKAKQVTIFNSFLREEMEMIKDFESYEDHLTKVLDVIENGLMTPERNSKMMELVKHYEDFNAEVTDLTLSTLKHKYNNLNDLKCKVCDLYS